MLDRGYTDFREHPRLLKKSLPARLAVQKRQKSRNTTKKAFSAPEQGAEKSATALFSTLTPSGQPGEIRRYWSAGRPLETVSGRSYKETCLGCMVSLTTPTTSSLRAPRSVSSRKRE